MADCAPMERLEAYVPDLALGWDVAGSAPWSTRHASMMFADLSGFTKLSERVAKVKGAGAEVVKRTINAVFEPCIDAVLREGGDVVKFAGDGLMMMFDGDGHELAAARAAVALQQAVGAIGRVSTPAGPARIGVSIGISTGEYLCLLSRVGRLEPVVVGEALDAMFAAEAFARSGQVVVDEQLAAVLPAGTTRAVPGSTRRRLRLDAPQLATAGRPPRRPASRGRAGDFLEPRVRAAIETGDTPPEHRSAAIAFLALDGLAAVRADGGIEALHAHVERFLGSVSRACAATEVCWLESDSDRDQIRVLLTAGAPYRTDVDEQRMLDAVWRIHEATDGMAVRTGVSRGKVFVGDVGHPLRRTYNVMGDAVNVAARLAGKAAHGEVVALEAVARARRSMARVEPRAPLAVKGKRLPLEVCTVLGLVASDESANAPQATIGRSAEIARLVEALAAVEAGNGRVVTIVGDAGMGSSHLVADALAGWHGALARTRGHEFERATPFAAVARLVRGALGIDGSATPEDAGAVLSTIVARVAPELVERLPLLADVTRAMVPSTAVVDAIRPEFRVEQSVVAAVALLRAIAVVPYVFVAEDVDRFDVSSSALLASISALVAETPWLVVVTTHVAPADDDVPAHGEVVTLAPLADDDVRRLVLTALGDVGIPDSMLDEIVRQAGGNPMIATELSLGWVAGARDLDLPDAVERAVAGRIDNLPADARGLMRDLSVAGSGAEWSLVTEVLGDACEAEGAWHSLQRLVGRSAGSVHFERDIYAVAAYQGLAHERRRTLHRAFAAALARRPYARFEAARIAGHAHAGGDETLAWTWSLAAADLAAAAGSAEDVAIHLAHAVDAADRSAEVGDAERLAVLERLGDAHERAGHPDDAHVAFTRARSLVVAGSPSHLRLLRKHARVAERAGAWTSSLRWVAKGTALVGDDADRDVLSEQAELELAASVVRFFQGRTKLAVDLARVAVGHAERAGADRAMAQAELQLEMCCSVLGLPERAAHGLRALELFELLDDHLGLANLRLNLGADCYAESRWDQALHHYRRSTAEYAVVGDLVGAALAENNRAEILTDQGRDDEALSAVQEARRGLKAAAYRMGVASTSSVLGRLAVRRGDFAEGQRWYAEARAEFVALDAAPLVADTDVRLLELDVWRGDLRAALGAIDRVRAFVDETDPSPMLRAGISRLQAWALTGPTPTADRRSVSRRRKIWDDAVDDARREAFPYEVALALDGRCAVLGDDSDAESAMERDDLLRRMGVVRPPRPPWMATVTRSSGT